MSHHRLSVDELTARFAEMGLGPDYARVLAEMDAAGAEDRVTDNVERITRRLPTPFAAFATASVSAWQ